LFDINQPLDFSAHPEAGYDLIIAVNVLHDASHVVQTLRRLKLLLKAGGRLLIVEATGETAYSSWRAWALLRD
jgi:yersiniabactin nonribosomal peptide/polyketide synthase